MKLTQMAISGLEKNAHPNFHHSREVPIQHEVCDMCIMCSTLYKHTHSHQLTLIDMEAKDNRKHHNYAICVLYVHIYCAVFYFILTFFHLTTETAALILLFHIIYLFI